MSGLDGIDKRMKALMDGRGSVGSINAASLRETFYSVLCVEHWPHCRILMSVCILTEQGISSEQHKLVRVTKKRSCHPDLKSKILKHEIFLKVNGQPWWSLFWL